MSTGRITYTTSVFDSLAAVPPGDWAGETTGQRAEGSAVGGMGMERRLIETFQQTMRSECRTWVVVVRDGAGRAVGQAVLCRFVVDALETTGPRVQALTRHARKIHPRFMRVGVLFCGLPVPSGQTHFRIAPGADADAVIGAIHTAMEQLARQTRSRLLVWREFDAAAAESVPLTRRGYLRGDIPCGHVLSVPPGQSFAGFADYSAALRSRYRQQVNATLRKRDDGQCELVTLYGPAAAAAFTPELHGLYCQVRNRAAYRMETLTPEFFREMLQQFGDRASLTLMRCDGRIVGFLFALRCGDTHHNLYLGMDYAANAACEVYFNLYYHDMDQAFARGCRHLDLGQTSDDFKSRLGTVPRPLYFFVRAAHPLAHGILRLVAPWAFPPVPHVEQHQVFREHAPSRSRSRARVTG